MRASHALKLCLGLVLVLPASAPASGTPPTAKADFALDHAKASDAAVIVKGIAGAKQVEALSDRAIRVRTTPDRLEVARQVVGLLDAPEDAPLAAFTVPSDQSRVAAFRFERTDPGDVMIALRRVLRIKNVTVREEPGLVIVRDTPEKTEGAQALVEILEKKCP